MSDCGFNIALLRSVVKLVETQLYMSLYFFLLAYDFYRLLC